MIIEIFILIIFVVFIYEINNSNIKILKYMWKYRLIYVYFWYDILSYVYK